MTPTENDQRDEQAEPWPGGAVEDWEFDPGNEMHLARHGVSAELVLNIAGRAPRFVRNPPREGRSGSHLMIGLSTEGRLWTIVVVKATRTPSAWRAITGWPSTGKEERRYHDLDDE